MKNGQIESLAETRNSRKELSWQKKPLEEVCNVEYGTRVVQKRDGGKGFPVYGGGGATFEMDGFNREDRLVIARFGMSEECTRFVAGKFYLNDSGLTVSPKNGVMHQRFLDYQMLALNDDIYALGKGTAQKNLDVPVFRTMPLFVPESLAEQQRIVGLLDEAFEDLATAKANAQKNLQNARALFESHLQSVFTQRGKGWVEKRMEDVCVIGDGNHSSNYPKKEELVAEGVPFIRATNLVDGAISDDDMRFLSPDKHAQLRKGHLKTGDILFTNRGEIGKTAIVDAAHDGSNLNSQIAWLRCSESLNNRFLFHVLNSGEIKSHLALSKNGAALQQFTIRQIKELKIPVPPKDQQKALVSNLDALSAETQRLARLYEQKLAALEALKKSLLHQAFTGEL